MNKVEEKAVELIREAVSRQGESWDLVHEAQTLLGRELPIYEYLSAWAGVYDAGEEVPLEEIQESINFRPDNAGSE